MLLSHDAAYNTPGFAAEGGESAREVRGAVEAGERKSSFLAPVCPHDYSQRYPCTVMHSEESDQEGNVLTYIKHDPSRRTSAFSQVDCVVGCGVGDYGKDLRGEADWATMGVWRFAGFAGRFCKRGASRRCKSGGEGLGKRAIYTWFERNGQGRWKRTWCGLGAVWEVDNKMVLADDG